MGSALGGLFLVDSLKQLAPQLFGAATPAQVVSLVSNLCSATFAPLCTLALPGLPPLSLMLQGLCVPSTAADTPTCTLNTALLGGCGPTRGSVRPKDGAVLVLWCWEVGDRALNDQ